MVRAFLLESLEPSGLDTCKSCLESAIGDDVCVEFVTLADLGRVLAGLPPTAPRVALLNLSDAHGEDGIARLRDSWPQLPIIVIAAAPDLVDISRWLAAGAADYVTPPITPASLIPRVLRAAGEPRPTEAVMEIEGFVGRSPAFRGVLQNISAVARCDATVLIEGETGTGKELCAHAIHRLSARRAKPLNTINCGAIPRELVENELFGHHKAAFTGASAAQLGLIAASEGGSLFFDEVDAFGHSEQATLLRFVQNQEYRPLGGTRVPKADVRVLAATNADLCERVTSRHFREDLYYRLDMLRLRMPPLRERREDIPLLARHALSTFARRFQARSRAFDATALDALVAHDWPGNIRQLEHVIGRAVAFAFHDEVITCRHLGLDQCRSQPETLATTLREGKRRLIADFERSRICACLAEHGGNISRAAQSAGKNRRAFFELMRKYAIRAEEFQVPAQDRRPDERGRVSVE